MKSSTPLVTIVALAVAFLVTAGLCAYEVWQNQQWKALVHAYAASEGKNHAKEGFLDGKLQLYTIYEPDGSGKPSATSEGPFQAVCVSYNPSAFQDRYTTAAFIEAYNKEMWTLHERPEKLIIRTKAQGHIE